MKIAKVSYYKETLPDLIEKLRDMVENNLSIVSKNISEKLTDSSLKTALESRKMAVEDVIWACKEIGRMEYELELEKENDRSYFIKIIPRLIKELKGMVENNLIIVSRDIASTIPDNKTKQALASRRISAEHAVWASRQVDELEKLMNGTDKEKEELIPMQNWTKRKANRA